MRKVPEHWRNYWTNFTVRKPDAITDKPGQRVKNLRPGYSVNASRRCATARRSIRDTCTWLTPKTLDTRSWVKFR